LKKDLTITEHGIEEHHHHHHHHHHQEEEENRNGITIGRWAWEFYISREVYTLSTEQQECFPQLFYVIRIYDIIVGC
jgi:hypothetical protein